MTITDVKLIKAGCGRNKDGRTYNRTYHIYFTGTFSDGALNTSTDSRIPRESQLHPDDIKAVVTDTKGELEEESPATGTAAVPGIAIWQVTYGPKDQGQIDRSIHPLQRPPRFEYGGGIGITEAVMRDVDDNPLVNSAGDLLSSFPERPISGGRVTIIRNEAARPGGRAFNFSNTVNSSSWYLAEAGQGLLGEITGSTVIEEWQGQQITYYEVQYPLLFRPDGWLYYPVDNGWRQKTTDSKFRNVTDDMGRNSTIPCLLDGQGKELPQGGTPVIFPTDGYKIIRESNWGSLGLPNPF